jgi:hypothetical protein
MPPRQRIKWNKVSKNDWSNYTFNIDLKFNLISSWEARLEQCITKEAYSNVVNEIIPDLHQLIHDCAKHFPKINIHKNKPRSKPCMYASRQLMRIRTSIMKQKYNLVQRQINRFNVKIKDIFPSGIPSFDPQRTTTFLQSLRRRSKHIYRKLTSIYISEQRDKVKENTEKLYDLYSHSPGAVIDHILKRNQAKVKLDKVVYRDANYNITDVSYNPDTVKEYYKDQYAKWHSKRVTHIGSLCQD